MNAGGRAIIQVAEKEESDAFWGFLGGKAEYPAFSKGCAFALNHSSALNMFSTPFL